MNDDIQVDDDIFIMAILVNWNRWFLEERNVDPDNNYCSQRLTGFLVGNNNKLFRDMFRMDKHCFLRLFEFLHLHGFGNEIIRMRKVYPIVKLAIFVEWLGHGECVRKQGDDWRLSLESISKARITVRDFLMNHYSKFVNFDLPDNVVDERIANNPGYAFFGNVKYAMDGTHIAVEVPNELKDVFRNRKNYTSTNVLLVCNFDMYITYATVGVEGSAHDSFVYQLAQRDGLDFPEGTYCLADCGYALDLNRILTPFRGTRYHLREWRDNVNNNILEPINARELYNLRHAKVRNIIERVNAVLKRRFKVLRSTLPFGVKKVLMLGKQFIHALLCTIGSD